MTLAPVIAVVGPSGVGKDSVMNALIRARPDFRRVRRVITRPEGEDGEDFERVTEQAFEHRNGRGEFALNWIAHGLSYGIPMRVHQDRRTAAALVVNLSRSVLLQAQDVFGSLVVLSLTADMDVLAKRLAARSRETGEAQARRLARAGTALPAGLRHVIEVDNSGALGTTVEQILIRLQLERG